MAPFVSEHAVAQSLALSSYRGTSWSGPPPASRGRQPAGGDDPGQHRSQDERSANQCDSQRGMFTAISRSGERPPQSPRSCATGSHDWDGRHRKTRPGLTILRPHFTWLTVYVTKLPVVPYLRGPRNLVFAAKSAGAGGILAQWTVGLAPANKRRRRRPHGQGPNSAGGYGPPGNRRPRGHNPEDVAPRPMGATLRLGEHYIADRPEQVPALDFSATGLTRC